MIPFHIPTLADRAWAEPLLRAAGDLTSESAFGTYFLWQDRYQYEIAQVNGYFAARSIHGYALPAGTGDLRPVLDALRADAAGRGVPLRIQVSDLLRDVLAAAAPQLKFTEHRGEADYLYRVADLAQLEGKKYHAKRNHIAKFNRLYSYQFEPVTTAAQEQECLDMMHRWVSSNENAADFRMEEEAIRLAFADTAALHIRAGLLRVDGNVIAFTAGEPVGADGFDLHFEKALTEYDGAYAVINQAFAAHCLTDCTWVNREEDMGLDGLRRAKLSYNPAQLLMKYTAEE